MIAGCAEYDDEIAANHHQRQIPGDQADTGKADKSDGGQHLVGDRVERCPQAGERPELSCQQAVQRIGQSRQQSDPQCPMIIFPQDKIAQWAG